MGTASDADAAMAAVVEHLNECYTGDTIPASKTSEEWEIERQILVMSFIGYLWHWGNDPVTPIASEIKFDLPLHAPRTGLPLLTSEVIRVGKIDHIVKWRGMVGNVERKSTSRSIDPDSDFWEKSQKDTQVSMYALAFHDMIEAGQFPHEVSAYLEANPDTQFGNTLYDVWRKPTIKPATLTQGATATLIETGEYEGVTFDIAAEPFSIGEGKEAQVSATVAVDGSPADVTPGKKGFAIRETPAMYGARLLQDIYTRPDFYFQRKEIARTDKDLAKARIEVYNTYQAMKMYEKNGCWTENEHSCRSPFPCPMLKICYGPGADEVCDGKTTPDGYRRIFNPAIHGESLGDED
jgi:hypothetical protein